MIAFAPPLIDLGASNLAGASGRDTIVRGIRNAATQTGLFLICNHGVPDALIADHFALARSFFALDIREKLEIDVDSSNCFRGYEPFGSQTIDAAWPGDLKEGFIMGPDLAPDHPHVVARYPNTGANLWPRRPVAFRANMERYVEAMNGLGRRIASLLARSLDLPSDYFDAPLHDPLTYSQLFHYPSVPGQRENHFGAAPHLDWGFITILLLDDVGGLDVFVPDGTWVPVPPVAGTFVIILGEMIVRLTNGRYRSAPHRVRTNASGRSRYSMPTFFDPPYDYRVECVPSCRPATGAAAFGACTVAEHMRAMATKTLTFAPN